ncbi:MAG TPA: hypothetical protein VF140_09840, partial [Phycicoccus sp.]
MSRSATWYLRRLRRMTPAEVASRVADRGRQVRWSRRRVRHGTPFPPPANLLTPRVFATPLPPQA